MNNEINLRLYASNKLKNLRENNNMTQDELADKISLRIKKEVKRQTVSLYENGDRGMNQDVLFAIADIFDTSINDFFPPIKFDNAEIVNVTSDCIQIPVLGTIKAGIALEAQQDIIEYVDIPKDWTKGGKEFYGLKISGDSMAPKYQTDDIVIFEKTNDYERANKKDCAVMVNGYDATFKNITITDNGVTLVPFNLNNSDNYQPTFYDKEQIASLPVKIIGIAREKRTRL